MLSFTEQERNDDRWKLRESLLLNAVERKDLATLNRLLHEEDVHGAQYVAGDSVFQYYWSQAQSRYATVAKLLVPYMKAPLTKKVGPESLRDLWTAAFGDPDDPQVKADVEKTIEILNSGACQYANRDA